MNKKTQMAEVIELSEVLEKRFGKSALNAKDFSDYLSVSYQYICEKIRARELPGFYNGRTFVIPVHSIALWLVNLADVKRR